jgi:hypothetical protein
MLVGQNTDAAAGAQQIDHRLKSLLAIEQFQASLAACPTHMRVNEAIAKFLIDTRIPHVADEFGHQLREQFPNSEMTQNEHYRNATAKFPVHRLDIVNRNTPEDFLWRHRGEFNATEKVSAESLEMAADKPTHFSRGLFIGKCNGNITVRQASIISGNEPGTDTEKLSNGKQKAHWDCGGNC